MTETAPVARAAVKKKVTAQDNQKNAQAKNIWQELAGWAETFKPWQKFVLAHAIRGGRLSDVQVDQAYALFLHGNGLAAAPEPAIEVPNDVTGRPAAASPTPIRLTRIGELQDVNALPPSAELTFSEGLTVIYGRNGAGKSGFARVLSNTCFSRNQHPILPNIYEEGEEGVEVQPSARIVISNGTEEVPLAFDGKTEHPDLKRISVFDTAVARTHLVEKNALSFKPAGFDIFPEMARVYDLLAARLNGDIERRTKENLFPQSFTGGNSTVSTFVAQLEGNADVAALKALATYGDAEKARAEEVQKQITDLLAQSVGETIKRNEEAKREISQLQKRLSDTLAELNEEKRGLYRAQLAALIEKNRIVAEQGAESFRHAALNGVGTPAWEEFLASAHTLAQVEDTHKAEGTHYPAEGDVCLLCRNAMDAPARALLQRFWGFVTGDMRQQAEEAGQAVDMTVTALKAMRFDFFAPTTLAHSHLTRINPDMAREVGALVTTMNGDCAAITGILEAGTGGIPAAGLTDLSASLTTLIEQIDADITRLKGQKVEDALKTLRADALVLQHREVLKNLLPQIEKFITDTKWIDIASAAPRRSLNPRVLTMKESDLYGAIIAGDYKKRLDEECGKLACDLPLEFSVQGDRGQTRRSLSLQGHAPDKILSEGEQRAVALADFLAEVSLNPANAGIILDDPVNSQDHQRKWSIAQRLVEESKTRQVVVFTHDFVFLPMLHEAAEKHDITALTHWVDKDSDGRPGQVSLDDCPATTAQYRDTKKAEKTLADAKAATGSARVALVQRGFGELRRTIEEIVPHYLMKQVVTRWTDRVIVTGLKKINWDEALISDIIKAFEDASAIMEGHSHTEERAEAPPEPKVLEDMVARVKDLIKRAKSDKPQPIKATT